MSDSEIQVLEEKLIDLEIRLTHQEDRIESSMPARVNLFDRT